MKGTKPVYSVVTFVVPVLPDGPAPEVSLPANAIAVETVVQHAENQPNGMSAEEVVAKTICGRACLINSRRLYEKLAGMFGLQQLDMTKPENDENTIIMQNGWDDDAE